MFNWLTGAFAEEAAEAAETVAEAAAETTEAAQAAVEQSSYVTDTLLKKLLGADVRFWLMILGLAALAAILFAIAKSRKAWSAKTVAYGALAIALSFVLSYIRLFIMPQGGSITPASMLPMMIFSAAFGIGPGVAAGLVFGVLQYLQGGDFLNIWQVLFDYVIAFSALGLAGLYKYLNKKWQVYAVLGALRNQADWEYLKRYWTEYCNSLPWWQRLNDNLMNTTNYKSLVSALKYELDSGELQQCRDILLSKRITPDF